jgi:hypothetical protein
MIKQRKNSDWKVKESCFELDRSEYEQHERGYTAWSILPNSRLILILPVVAAS